MEIKILLPNTENKGSFDQRVKKSDKPNISLASSGRRKADMWLLWDVTRVTVARKRLSEPD